MLLEGQIVGSMAQGLGSALFEEFVYDESGITAVGAVIAAAIDDAIGRPGAVTQLPVTPARLRAILRRL